VEYPFAFVDGVDRTFVNTSLVTSLVLDIATGFGDHISHRAPLPARRFEPDEGALRRGGVADLGDAV
jgi:hypothetical protein